MFGYLTQRSQLNTVLSKLFHITLAIASVRCDSDGEEELQCDNYFLTEAKFVEKFITKTVFYNEDGRIAVMKTVSTNRFKREEFTYNAQQQLIEVADLNYMKTRFTYDDVGRVDSFYLRFWNAHLWYRGKNYYGDDGKLSRQEFFQDTDEMTWYRTFEYPSTNVIEVLNNEKDMYGEFLPEDLFTFTVDDNPRPFPDEYYILLSTSVQDEEIALPNNPISLVWTNKGWPKKTETYTIETNSDGYPKDDGPYDYTYACEPVREE